MRNISNLSFTRSKRKSILLAGVSIGVLLAASTAILPAFADDFVVSNAINSTNGGNTIDGDDTLRVTSGGSIQPTTDADSAVDVTGSNNVITTDEGGLLLSPGTYLLPTVTINGFNNTLNNSGSITSSNIAFRATGGAGHVVNNFGLIESTAIAMEFLTGTDNAIVYNGHDGTITGDNTGIRMLGANARVTNDGLIFGNNYAVRFEDTAATDATVVNNGTLRSGGASNTVISEAQRTTIVNNGTIDSGAVGVRFSSGSSDSHLTNNGTIKATVGFTSVASGSEVINNGIIDSNDDAIRFAAGSDNSTFVNTSSLKSNTGAGVEIVSDNVIITNYGKIVGVTANAINVTGANATLNLLAPSFLAGGLSQAVPTTINITTGASHSVLWTFDEGGAPTNAPVISGPVSGFYSATTGQFATYDPTALAVAFDQLSETSGLISDLAALKSYGDGPWISGFGGYGKFDGNASTLDRTMFNGGVAFGNSFQLGNGFQFQAMGGYIGNRTKAASRWTDALDNKSDGFFASINSKLNTSRFDTNVALSGGVNRHSDRRFVNDNLAVNSLGQHLGESWATSSYSSFWISPEVTVSTSFGGSDGWTYVPSAQARYSFQSIGGHTETGSNGNAVVGARNIGILNTKAELAAVKTFGFGKFTGRAGVQSRNNVGGQDTDVTLVGLSQSVASAAENRFSAYVGAEGQFDLGNQRFLGVGSKVSFGGGATSISASAKLKLKF